MWKDEKITCIEGLSMSGRRTNPSRNARSPGALIDMSDIEGSNSDGSDDSPFFSPGEEDRGCPTCRKVPTSSLRLFPDAFKCPVCMTEDILNVFALSPCGHCLCGDCKDKWMPGTKKDESLPDIANMNMSDNQGAASGRRGRPLMSPHERNANSTRQRKNIIIKAIENWEFNNGVITDAIFYCDISETFQSPDEEPREVFRVRLKDAVNSGNRDFLGNDDSWVIALQNVCLEYDGNSPLQFKDYKIELKYHCFTLSIRINRIKGLKKSDLIESIGDEFENIEISEPARGEYVHYFLSNLETCNVEEEGDE